MENTALATAETKLTRTLGKSSLMDLAKSARRSLLLVDTSGSMSNFIASGGTRIDALRKTVTELKSTHSVPVASFSGRGVRMIEGEIPNPAGHTPLTEAIDFGKYQGATHLVVVTDGEPDNQHSALDSARSFGGVIDVFFIGDPNDFGAAFAKRLAESTGGNVNVTDLGAPKQLAAGIAGLLGDGAL